MGEISKSIIILFCHDNVASSLHLLTGDWCWLNGGPLYLLPRSTLTPPAPGPVSWPQDELSSALLAAVPLAQVTPHDPCLSCWLVAGWAELLIDLYLIFTQIVRYFTLDIYWLGLVVDINKIVLNKAISLFRLGGVLPDGFADSSSSSHENWDSNNIRTANVLWTAFLVWHRFYCSCQVGFITYKTLNLND